MADELLEPLKAYNNVYKDKIIQAAGEYFDNLIVKSQISVESNRQTVARLKRLQKERDNLRQKLGSQRAKKAALIIFGIIFIALIFIPIFIMVKTTVLPIWAGVLICIAMVAIGVTMIVFGIRMNKTIRELQKRLDAVLAKISDAIREATLQMAPLNAIYDWNMHIKVINSVIPIIHLDEYVDFGKHDKMIKCYGLGENHDEDYSAVYVQSGEVLGNPFLIRTSRVHKMIDKVFSKR